MDPLELGRKPDCAAGDCHAAVGDGAEPGSLSRVWLPEIAERIVSFLPANVVACTFRLLDKAACEQFADRRTIHLSQPSPAWAFAAHWLSPDSCRGLSLKQRQQLVALTAASGDVANLRVAQQAAGCTPMRDALYAAARAGALETCQHLAGDMRVVLKLYWDTPLAHAAEGGSRSVCEWCLANGAERSWHAVSRAFGGGHTELAELLRPPGPIPSSYLARSLLCEVAHGCDLATLGREWERVLQRVRQSADPADDGEGEGPDYDGELSLQEINDDALASAAGSPTPDWEAKAEFLLSKGAALRTACVDRAAAAPGSAAVERLAWLKARGLDPRAHVDLTRAACAGNVGGMRWLMAEGVRSLPGGVQDNLAYFVPLPALQLLLEEGVVTPTRQLVGSAIRQSGAGLPSLRWLVERYGEAVLDTSAAMADDGRWWGMTNVKESGSAEVLRFFLERGAIAVEDPDVWRAVATGGSEAGLDWLAEVGWPRPANGEPFKAAARNGDARTLQVLRRLGLDWGPPGLGVLAAAVLGKVGLPALRWMVEEGCPLGEAAMHKAVAEAQKGGSPIQADVLAWLEAQGLRLGGLRTGE